MVTLVPCPIAKLALDGLKERKDGIVPYDVTVPFTEAVGVTVAVKKAHPPCAEVEQTVTLELPAANPERDTVLFESVAPRMVGFEFEEM